MFTTDIHVDFWPTGTDGSTRTRQEPHNVRGSKPAGNPCLNYVQQGKLENIRAFQTPRLPFIPYLLVSSCMSDSGSPGLLQALLLSRVIYPLPFDAIPVLFSLMLLVPVHPPSKTLIPSLVRFHFAIPFPRVGGCHWFGWACCTSGGRCVT